jgi:hypothetical protein
VVVAFFLTHVASRKGTCNYMPPSRRATLCPPFLSSIRGIVEQPAWFKEVSKTWAHS